jgi:hypothetical protein
MRDDVCDVHQRTHRTSAATIGLFDIKRVIAVFNNVAAWLVCWWLALGCITRCSTRRTHAFFKAMCCFWVQVIGHSCDAPRTDMTNTVVCVKRSRHFRGVMMIAYAGHYAPASRRFCRLPVRGCITESAFGGGDVRLRCWVIAVAMTCSAPWRPYSHLLYEARDKHA